MERGFAFPRKKMKTQRSGPPDGIAPAGPSADRAASARPPLSPRRRALAAAVAVLALLVVVAVFGGHALLGLGLTRGLSALTGDAVSIGSFQISAARSIFTDVEIRTPNGDPLLRVGRVALEYTPAELVRNGSHRFGLRSLHLTQPVFTIVRHVDGGYNLSGSNAPTAGPATAPSSVTNWAAGWNLEVAVDGGQIVLVDEAPAAADLARQRIANITLRASVRGEQRSTVRATGTVLGRAAATGGERLWPVDVAGALDFPRGAALLNARAERLPIRGLLGFLTHSGALRIDDGVLQQVEFKLFALDIRPTAPLRIHAGGSSGLTGGRLHIAALARPVTDVRGRIILTDDGVWTRRLDARLAGWPLVARGGVFDRAQPTLRLGISADGDLRDLRTAFAFSRRVPASGGAHVETLLEAPVAGLLVRTALRVPRGRYGAIPLSGVGGRIDYHDRAVVLDGISGHYGAAALDIGGRFLLGGPALDSAIAAVARASGRTLPYAENVAPDATVDLAALFLGGAAGFRTAGSLGLVGPRTVGVGMLAVNERGTGEFGPFFLARADGSTLAGALRIERPTSRSAAWLTARRFMVEVPTAPARLAGLSVPAFPPVAGRIDADLGGGGTPNAFALAGSVSGAGLRVGAVRLGTGRANLGGTLANLKIGSLRLDGPVGRFTGSAAAARGAFALRGEYAGSLDRLVPLTGQQQGHGAVRGHVLATLNGADVVVASPDATLRDGRIRGVALDTAAGTIAVHKSRFTILAATGRVLGRRAVAADVGGRIAFSAPDIPFAALAGTGLPLGAGNVSAYGLADLRGPLPAFTGTVSLAGGETHGYRVAGDALVALAGSRAQIFAATGALGSTYGSIGGVINGVGTHAFGYDLTVAVPLGEIAVLRQDLNLPVRLLDGSFAAALHVRGSGTRPAVVGRIDAPEGSYHGLAFRAGVAPVNFGSDGLGTTGATLTIGSTKATIDARESGGRYAVGVRSPAIDLADFNDYFDGSETLAGRGAADLAFATTGKHLATRARLAFTGLRYRRSPAQDVSAHWHMQGDTIAATAGAHGPGGSLSAAVRIAPGAGADPLAAFRQAAYDGQATLDGLDLETWLPVFESRLPVLGRVNGRLSVRGRLPDLAVRVDADAPAVNVAGYAVTRLRLRATARGSRIAVAESSAGVGLVQLAGSGRLGLAARDPLAFDLRITSADIGSVAGTFIPALRGRDIAGALDADVRLGGTRAVPTIAGGFDLTAARYGGFVVPRTIGALALAGRAIELRDADVEFARGQAFVAGSLPLTVVPFGVGPPHAPLSFDVTARSVDLAQFGPLFPAGTVLGGTVDGRFGVEGTVDRPRLLGSLAVSGGSYTSPLERAPIEHVGASLAFAGNRVALDAFHADVGGGTLDGSGGITLPLGSGQARYEASASATAARLDFPAYGRGTVDGVLRLTGGSGTPQVSGEVSVRDAVIPVSAVYGGGGASGSSGGVGTIDPALAIHAVAGRNVRVRNSIVDIGVAGAVDVGGRFTAPQLTGGFSATDGTISSYNHVFRIVNAAVSFNPADGPLPTIAARAISRVSNPDPDPSRNIGGSANIIVSVSGTPDSNNLQVTYTSDPAYSQEQIIGLLLDVPALLGAVNFDLNGGAGSPLLRGAPGETNALLPPGVTPEQVGAISFNEEVFSLLNGQFTQRALNPVERDFERVLGLSDIEFTVDYGGGIGYSLRRQIGKRDFYAFLSQTVSYPERLNVGFELVPKPFQTVNFSYYQQNGVTSLITNATPGEGFLSSTRRLTSVQPLGNRSGFSINFNRRF